jgi:hypothetical protein
MLRRLRRSYVHDNGFVNLRCDASAHCPNVKNATQAGYPASFLTRDRQRDLDAQYAEFHAIWGAIFPGQPVPPSLGTVPGAQFALARETARKVPLEELKRLRQWIIDVDFNAKKAGAVFEYIWQIIFLGPSYSVLCPMPHECYCSLYGICLQSISSNPEVLVEEATRSGYQRRRMSNQLNRIQYLQNQSASRGRDLELADLSNGHIDPGLAGLADYITVLERNITELTYEIDELVAQASIPKLKRV